MSKFLLIALACVALSGCGVPVAVVAGGMGVAVGALRLDDDLLQLWMSQRGVKTTTDSPVAGAKSP